MTIRQSYFAQWLIRLVTMISCICLGENISLAQSDVQDHLQIIPPPLPRYRRIRPAFQVKADPTQKPLPKPVYIPPPVAIAPIMTAVPRPIEDPAKRQARIRERRRRETQSQILHERLIGVGKALGFVLLVGVGIAAMADIVRQFRKVKRTEPLQDTDSENDQSQKHKNFGRIIKEKRYCITNVGPWRQMKN